MAARMSDWLISNAPLLRNVSVLALLGYSVQLALRSGVMSFATIGFFALGGYLSANLLQADWNWVVVLFVVLIFGTLVALVISPVLRRLRHLYLAMATLAFTLFVQSLALTWRPFTGGAEGMYGVPRVLPQAGMLVIVLIVVFAVWYTQRGAQGRATAALRYDELLSASLGVNVGRQEIIAFAASGAVGALAGFVRVSTAGVFGPEDINFTMVVDALTVVVLGGTILWLGPLVGAIVVATLPLFLADAGHWNLILQAVIVLIVVVYQPGGIVGMVERLIGGARRRLKSDPKKEIARMETR
jgi:branched-chain amino acid transport system permease protein